MVFEDIKALNVVAQVGQIILEDLEKAREDHAEFLKKHPEIQRQIDELNSEFDHKYGEDEENWPEDTWTEFNNRMEKIWENQASQGADDNKMEG